MKKQFQFDNSINKIGAIFSELKLIVSIIKENFEEENEQDHYLTLEVIEYHLKIITNFEQVFKNRVETNWELSREIKSVIQTINSFFRQFDNPFLGSKKWYQQIEFLLDELSKEVNLLEKLS